MFKNLFASKKVSSASNSDTAHLYGKIASVTPFSMVVEMHSFIDGSIDKYEVSFDKKNMAEQHAVALDMAKSKKNAKMIVSVKRDPSLIEFNPVIDLINFQN